jgi:FdhE protein
VATSERDLQTLKALEVARQQHPALVDLLSFYYDLYRVQFQAKPDLAEPEVRDEMAMRWRLEGGIPQVTFDQLGVEPERFARLVEQVTDVFVLHNHPALQAGSRQWTPGELVARAREVFESWDTLTAPRLTGEGFGEFVAGGLSAQAVGFALAPYLQRAAERILPCLQLALWTRGYCPICGGRPNLALLGKGGGPRQLVCSRCASVWAYAGAACPFCESEGMQTYYVSEDGLYHLYVCPGCNAYLKAVDLAQAQHEVYPLVEYLLTVGMDLAAHQEGYGN